MIPKTRKSLITPNGPFIVGHICWLLLHFVHHICCRPSDLVFFFFVVSTLILDIMTVKLNWSWDIKHLTLKAQPAGIKCLFWCTSLWKLIKADHARLPSGGSEVTEHQHICIALVTSLVPAFKCDPCVIRWSNNKIKHNNRCRRVN